MTFIADGQRPRRAVGACARKRGPWFAHAGRSVATSAERVDVIRIDDKELRTFGTQGRQAASGDNPSVDHLVEQ